MGNTIDNMIHGVPCKQACACVKAYDPTADYGEISVPFRDSGSRIISLVIGLDYMYSPGNELTASVDAKHVYRMLERSDQSECTVALDYQNFMPTKEKVIQFLKESGARCKAGDWFVFFFAGHGDNMPGASSVEAFGQDQAFVTPDSRGKVTDPKSYLVDDDFALALDHAVPAGVKILCLIDCCHSGSICDIDSFKYTHDIYQISAAQDDQEAGDTGSGGIFTKSLGQAMQVLSMKYGTEDYSIQELYDCCHNYSTANITEYQDISFCWSGTHPADVAWPLTADLKDYLSVNKYNAQGFRTDKIKSFGVPPDFAV